MDSPIFTVNKYNNRLVALIINVEIFYNLLNKDIAEHCVFGIVP